MDLAQVRNFKMFIYFNDIECDIFHRTIMSLGIKIFEEKAAPIYGKQIIMGDLPQYCF